MTKLRGFVSIILFLGMTLLLNKPADTQQTVFREGTGSVSNNFIVAYAKVTKHSTRPQVTARASASSTAAARYGHYRIGAKVGRASRYGPTSKYRVEFEGHFGRKAFYRSASPAARRTHKKSDGRAASRVGARDRYGTLYVAHSTDTGK